MNGNGRYPYINSWWRVLDKTARYVIQGLALAASVAVLKTGVDIRDGLIKVNDSIPKMQIDIDALKEQGKTFATKDELKAEAERVTNAFKKELEKQKARRVVVPSQ